VALVMVAAFMGKLGGQDSFRLSLHCWV
jgi:hypothetical protein